ncbi:MAG: hypothetical protein QG578_1394 [Thermodesulfobacteriota bacterium]|nr:hypothetical protein [Thermodesulfobacteriota bacterium]
MKDKIKAWKKSAVIAFVLLGMNLFNQAGEAADVPKGLLRAGDIIPAFSVPVPKNKTDRSYLMLKKSGIFQPAEMDVKLLIIEVLNVY